MAYVNPRHYNEQKYLADLKRLELTDEKFRSRSCLRSYCYKYVTTPSGREVKVVSNQLTDIIPIEEAYDYIVRAHIACEHGNTDDTMSILCKRYFIPYDCVSLVLINCDECHARRRAASGSYAPARDVGNWRMSIFMVDDFVILNRRMERVLIMRENATNFVKIRAVPKGPITDKWLTDTFLSIFKEVGFPEKVYVPADILPMVKEAFNTLYQIDDEHPSVEAVETDDPALKRDTEDFETTLKGWIPSVNIPMRIGGIMVEAQMNSIECEITGMGNDGSEETIKAVPVELFNHMYGKSLEAFSTDH